MNSSQRSSDSLTNGNEEFEAIIGSATQWQSSQQIQIIAFRPNRVQRSIELMQISNNPEAEQPDRRLSASSRDKPLPPTPKISSISSFPKKLISAPSSFGSSIMKGARRLSIFKFRNKKTPKVQRFQLEARVQTDKGTQTESLRTKASSRADRRIERRVSHSSVAHSSTFSSEESSKSLCFKHNKAVKRKRPKSKAEWPIVSSFPYQCTKEKEAGSPINLQKEKRNSWTETPSAMLPAEWAYTGPPPWNKHAANAAAATSTTVDSTGTYESRYSDPSRPQAEASGRSIRPTNFTRRVISDSSVMLQPKASHSVASALGIPSVHVEDGEKDMTSSYPRPQGLNRSRQSITRVIQPFRKRVRPVKVITDNGSEFESPLRREVAADQIADSSVQATIANDTVSLDPSPMPSPANASLKYQMYFPAFTPAVETDVPEHFKGSPLCPLHPKHKSTHKFCPFHGRLPSSEEMLLTPSSRTDSDKSRASDGSGVDPFDRRGFQLEIPEHSVNSPLCPANLKYNPNGRKVCVYHGRGISRETKESSEDSIPRKDAMMTFTSGIHNT